MNMDARAHQLLVDRLQIYVHKRLFRSLRRAMLCFTSASRVAKIPKCVQCGREQTLDKNGSVLPPLRNCPKCRVICYCSKECERKFRSSLKGKSHYCDGNCQFLLSMRESKWPTVGVTQLTALVLLHEESLTVQWAAGMNSETSLRFFVKCNVFGSMFASLTRDCRLCEEKSWVRCGSDPRYRFFSGYLFADESSLLSRTYRAGAHCAGSRRS